MSTAQKMNIFSKCEHDVNKFAENCGFADSLKKLLRKTPEASAGGQFKYSKILRRETFWKSSIKAVEKYAKFPNLFKANNKYCLNRSFL